MKKSLIALAVLTVSGFASAQSVNYYLENSGRVNSSAATYATVNGDGTSNSVAQGAAMAQANGTVGSNPINGGQKLVLTGASNTTGSAMAFNVSTGNGTGSASSVGWSDAQTYGNNTFTNGHGTITMAGSTDGGMTNNVRNGVDVGVQAGRSQDGYADGTSSGSFDAKGKTQQTWSNGVATINGNVTTDHASQSTADAGGVTFTGGTPAGQSAAQRWANGGTQVNVSGSFDDPAH